MLDIDANEDIEAYKTGPVKGLTLREAFFAGVTVAAGSVTVLFCHHTLGIPIELAIYIAMPLSLLCAMTGFYGRNGMNFIEKVKAVTDIQTKKPYTYQSEEGEMPLKQEEEKSRFRLLRTKPGQGGKPAQKEAGEEKE